MVSIHVPARGTTNVRVATHNIYRFQSTFPRGERLERITKQLYTSMFQSTFPRGERRYLILLQPTSQSQFQSTFPRGERPRLRRDTKFLRGFQSTFPRGERLYTEYERIVYKGFQSTFPRGERRLCFMKGVE